jgi:hypothetical protein
VGELVNNKEVWLHCRFIYTMIFRLEFNLGGFARKNNVRLLILNVLNRSCREALHSASQFWGHLRNNSSTVTRPHDGVGSKKNFN